MITQKVSEMLLVIGSYGTTGEYLILDKEELSERFSEKPTSKELDDLILQLQVGEYIALRYADSEVYCLAIQPKGVLRYEQLKEIEAKREEEERLKKEAEQNAKESRTDSPQPVVVYQEVAAAPAPAPVVVPSEPVSVPWKKIILLSGVGAFVGGLLATAVGWLVMFLTK